MKCAPEVSCIARICLLIVQSGYGCCPERILLLCGSDTVVVQNGYGCCAERIRLLCRMDTVVARNGYGYCAERIGLLCRTDTEALFIFRLLPLLKGCGWLTCHMIIHNYYSYAHEKENQLTVIRFGVCVCVCVFACLVGFGLVWFVLGLGF